MSGELGQADYGVRREKIEVENKKPRFPTAFEFRMRLLRLRKSEQNEVLPPVPENPTASDVARYGRVNIQETKNKERSASRGDFSTYLYNLAKLMSTKEGYLGINAQGEPTDVPSLWVSNTGSTHNIHLRDGWQAGYEGSHRILALRLLGPKFVEKSGMNDWVKIDYRQAFPLPLHLQE